MISAVFAWNGNAIVIGIPTGKPAVPDAPDFDAFTQPPDPPGLRLCRGCSEHGVIDEAGVYGTVRESHGSLVHPCDGGSCQCPTCDLVRTVREMSAMWDLFDRADGWCD